MVTERAKSVTLSEEVCRDIRSDIQECRLLPGAKLRISDLCERFQVSLGAVREALSRLTAEGLVRSEAQRGFFVSPVSRDELVDITRVRIDIECLCLRSAMSLGDVAWESGIVAAFYRLSRVDERDPNEKRHLSGKWSALHAEFHQALVAACDSAWLLRIRTMLFEKSERYRKLSVPVRRGDRNVNREHKILMDAVISRDAVSACDALATHLGRTTEIILSVPGLLKVEPEHPRARNQGTAQREMVAR